MSDGLDAAPEAEDAVPDFVAARDHVREELLRFVRALRRAGASVPANASTTAARALVEVGLEDRDRARIALKASLLTEREDIRTFDDLFEEFWRRLAGGLDAGGPAPRPDDGPDGDLTPLGAEAAASGERYESGAKQADEADAEQEQESRSGFDAVVARNATSADEDGTVTTALSSPTGRRTEITVPDIDAEGVGKAFDDLTRALAELPGRRWRAGTDVADIRRVLRTSVSTGGTVVDVPKRERDRNAVRALLFVDVSRSVLDVVDRGFLVQFLRRARTAWRDARVFFFDDDLREVTQSFDTPTARTALDALEGAEAEWGGGTRIGDSIERIRTEFPEAVDRRSVVFVVSDGLETGEVSDLERGMSWLSRRSRATFWLNPLAASPGYEPTARGMAAALPYLDGLFAFAGPGDLDELARQLRRQYPSNRIGYEYESRGTEPAEPS